MNMKRALEEMPSLTVDDEFQELRMLTEQIEDIKAVRRMKAERIMKMRHDERFEHRPQMKKRHASRNRKGDVHTSI